MDDLAGDAYRRPLPRSRPGRPGLRPDAPRLRLHPADAAFLADALDRLPGADDEDVPATLDLNGRVCVRVRGGAGPATELVLARSSYAGPPARAAMNRE